MRLPRKRSRLLIAAAASVAVAACGKTDSQSMDDGLKLDLAAATARPQLMVVSEIEGGETVAPKRSPQRAPVPVTAPRQPIAAVQIPKPRAIPAPAPVAPQKAVVVAPAPAVDARHVPPLPSVPTRQGTDAAGRKEAEILRQMPWIRP